MATSGDDTDQQTSDPDHTAASSVSTKTRQASTAQRRSVKRTTSKSRKGKVWRTFRIRTVSTLVLIGTFVGFTWAGHVPLMFMILGIQYVMVRELFRLAQHAQQQYFDREEEREGRRPVEGVKLLPSQQWYFFSVAAFWMYFRFVKNQLIVEITSNATLAHLFGWVLRRHTLLAYSLYTAGFVTFVLKLQKGKYTYQFGQYAWTHMILLVVFIPSSFFVSNIFDGLIWFLLPCSMVIINDIGAYLCGVMVGHRKLIALSPKKTWEGFIGGCIITLIASWYLAGWLSRFNWMVCRRTDLSVFSWLRCQPDELYQPTEFALRDIGATIPASLLEYLAFLRAQLPAWEPMDTAMHWLAWYQLHALVMAMFASIIAPFGGFFASGFKRGFKIKDFGDSIPGHGGMTDRMDCQIVMAVFAYLYFNNYVNKEVTAVGTILNDAMQLQGYQQLELFGKLANVLAGEELVPISLLDDIAPVLAKHGLEHEFIS